MTATGPGFGRVSKRRGSLGVLQKIEGRPEVYLDGGHNRDAVANLAAFLQAHTSPPRSLVFGIMRDKDIEVVLGLLSPLFERIYFTSFKSARVAALATVNGGLSPGVSRSRIPYVL